MEQILEDIVKHIGRHIELALEYQSKQQLIRFKHNMDKLRLGKAA